MLGRVVEKLNLDSEWGKKYANGHKLKVGETIALLKRRMELRPLQNTAVVDLRVSSDDPVEAAKLANTTAEIYTQFRLEQRRELNRKGILTLKGQLSEQEQTINTMRDRLEQLKTTLESEKNGTNHESYFSTKNELEKAMRYSDMLQKKIKEVDDNRYIINDPVVNILEHAVPPTRPIGPNRPLAVAILSFGVLLIVGGFYLIRVSYRTRV
jgi:capsular polysaccharide biosynthesis protein